MIFQNRLLYYPLSFIAKRKEKTTIMNFLTFIERASYANPIIKNPYCMLESGHT